MHPHLTEQRNYNLNFLSYFYLKGVGIEIGPLDRPLPLYAGVKKCFYIDIRLPSELRECYPERKGKFFVDIKGDGAALPFLKKESLDFIIALNFLEHTPNPLGTIVSHLEKLKPNGVLFYSLPDKRYTFDRERQLTTLDHLIADFKGKDTTEEHYKEWIEKVEKITAPKEFEKRLHFLKAINFPIHFHTFIPETFIEAISFLSFNQHLPLYLEILLREQDFFIVVLKKKPITKIISSMLGSQWYKDFHKMQVIEDALKKARKHAAFLEAMLIRTKEHVKNLEKELALTKAHVANLEFNNK
jgi:SAM-dependent methyltransferase